MTAMYYLEKTDRRGRKDLIRIDSHVGETATGVVIASDTGDTSMPWSCTLNIIRVGAELGRYDFTHKPWGRVGANKIVR